MNEWDCGVTEKALSMITPPSRVDNELGFNLFPSLTVNTFSAVLHSVVLDECLELYE